MNKMKVYGYIRVSGQSQLNGNGFERQESVIEKYASSKKFIIQQFFREEAISGSLDETERPAFQEMVTAILRNGVKAIIIEGMDRLARDLQVQTALIAYLASKSITLISARTDQDITNAVLEDPMQKALVQIQGVFSELEKNLLVKKLRVAREHIKKERGKCEGRRSYKNDYPDILYEIKKLRRKPKGRKRLSYEKIAESLNSAGKNNANGQPFTGNAIQQILRRVTGQ